MSIFYNKHFNANLQEVSLEKSLKITLQENILYCVKALIDSFLYIKCQTNCCGNMIRRVNEDNCESYMRLNFFSLPLQSQFRLLQALH